MKTKSIILIITTLILGSCKTYKNYYYPLDTFQEVKIYKFECAENPNKTQYWKLSVNEKGNLVTEAFNSKFIQFEYFEERYGKKGSEVVYYAESDENGVLVEKVLQQKDVFKWKGEGPYAYSVHIVDDAKLGIFEKTREFVKEEKITILGETFRAKKFKGTYTYSIPIGSKIYEFYQFSYYVPNFGMVKYERFLPDGSTANLELTKIISEKEWKSLNKTIR